MSRLKFAFICRVVYSGPNEYENNINSNFVIAGLLPLPYNTQYKGFREVETSVHFKYESGGLKNGGN